MVDRPERRPQKSDHYQWCFNEISFPIELLQTFTNDDSVYRRLNPYAYNEEIADLEEQLRVEFWRVIDEALTERQRQVVRLLAEGYTQMEVAKKLNVNQSSVAKQMGGSTKYFENGMKHSYGGIIRKVRKVIETDERIRVILERISDLRAESWL